MRVERQSIFPASADDVWELLLQPETLEHITGGLVDMEPVEPLSAGRCLYTDRIDIEAGPMTPVVWAFAQLFYRIRQRRWLDLLPTI